MEWMPVGCELPSTSDLRHTLQSHGRRRIVRFIGDSLSYDHYKYVRSCVLAACSAVQRLSCCPLPACFGAAIGPMTPSGSARGAKTFFVERRPFCETPPAVGL